MCLCVLCAKIPGGFELFSIFCNNNNNYYVSNDYSLFSPIYSIFHNNNTDDSKDNNSNSNNLSDYSYSSLCGLIQSVGGLTASVVDQSTEILLNYTSNTANENDLLKLLNDLNRAFIEYKGHIKYIIALFNTITSLLKGGVFLFLNTCNNKSDKNNKSKFQLIFQLFNHCLGEIKKTNSTNKLLASIPLLLEFIQFNQTENEEFNTKLYTAGKSNYYLINILLD